jgi:hypothetical protein
VKQESKGNLMKKLQPSGLKKHRRLAISSEQKVSSPVRQMAPRNLIIRGLKNPPAIS